MDEDILIPSDQPIFCQASTKRDDFHVGCCDDFDGCNANLTLPDLIFEGLYKHLLIASLTNQYRIWVWYGLNFFCIFTDRNNALPVNLELILGIILPVLIMALCITLAYFLFIHKKGISMCRVHKSVLLESSPTPSSYPPSSRSFGSESKFKKGARSDCDYPLLGVISGNGGPPSSSGPGPYTLDESLSSQRTIKELVEETTGSGSGLPILIQRTIARQINLEKEIGRGR